MTSDYNLVYVGCNYNLSSHYHYLMLVKQTTQLISSLEQQNVSDTDPPAPPFYVEKQTLLQSTGTKKRAKLIFRKQILIFLS